MNAIRHVVLGLFFFATVAVLGFVTIYLGDFTPEAEKTTLVAWFDTVDGLGAGDPVQVRGVPSGRVKTVDFVAEEKPHHRLKVTFVLDRSLTLRRGYEIAIGSPSLLGGKQLDVLPGDGEPLVPADYADLLGVADANIARQLSGLLGDNRDDVRRIVNGGANLVTDLDSGKRSLSGILFEATTRDDLAVAITAGRSALEKLDHGSGSIAKALNDPGLHDSLTGFLDNGKTLLQDTREKPGVLHGLIYDETTWTKLKAGIEGLGDAVASAGAGHGFLGKLFAADSEDAWDDFRVAIDGIRATMDDVRAGKGAVGKLFSDPETEQHVANLARRFSGIADDIGLLTESMKRGKGVLGYLIADEEARKSVAQIVDQIVRAIEDAREAAPVSSVASFLFGQL